MARINDNYLKLKAGYLFPEIGRRVTAFSNANPDAKIIRMGIGDVTEPLPPAIIEAMHKAVDEMAKRETFRGYGPEQGYAFLRDAIAKNEYAARNCEVHADEIFVSDGSKCDTGNILDILAPGKENVIAVGDPVYPVYVDTNVMAGHTGQSNAKGEYEGIVYLPMTAENGFKASLPTRKVDVIYLCFPNNPTGAVIDRGALTEWVLYAKENDAIILYDAAYEAYISVDDIPHSIYEIPGAREVAIEFRSCSKNAGFTGTRCAWTVVPKALMGTNEKGEKVELHKLWMRRHTTKFNGVPYIIQRGAEAIYSDQGKQQVADLIAFYMQNAAIIRSTFTSLGMEVYGGIHAPYVWVKTPSAPGSSNRIDSWGMFDKMLRECHVVITPGSGFGASGEGYFRVSAFNSRANVEEAMQRIRTKFQ